MAKAKQTIKIRIRKNGGGSVKPCGTCGGTGVVRSSGSSGRR